MDASQESTQPELQVDREITELLAEAMHPDADPDASLAQWRSEQPVERLVWGLARALREYTKRDNVLVAHLRMVSGEVQAERDKLAKHIGFLQNAMKIEALAHRDAGRGATLDVPGIGTWATRKIPAVWVLPSRKDAVDALIKHLHDNDADSYALLVERREHLDTAKLRAQLDETGEIPPGVTRREEGVSVTFKLHIEETP